jgi:hypothetical protein
VVNWATGACDDGNPCTEADACLNGTCSGQPGGLDDNDGDGYSPCDGDCDDNDMERFPGAGELCGDGIDNDCNDLVDDGCGGPGSCAGKADATPCDDGNACTTPDVCELGTCVGLGPIDCNDGVPCTADLCDQFLGCQSNMLPPGTSCSDGDPCTDADQCDGIFLCIGTPIDCDDGFDCTLDACSGGSCSSVPQDGAPCEDGEPCTALDECLGLVCASGPVASCDDGNICTDDACLPGDGCVNEANSAPCEDGDICTSLDLCFEGVCQGNTPIDCDDNDPCTADSCNPGLGCESFAVAELTPCDDGLPCTIDEVCQGGACTGPANPECILPVTVGIAAHYSAKVATSLVLNGDDVTQWQDLSGFDRHLANTGAPTMLQPTGLNGQPAVDFGGDVGMVTSPFENSLDMTLFMVVLHRPMDGYGCYAHHGDRDFDWSLEQSAFNSNFVQLQSQNDGNCGQTLAVGQYYVLASRISGNDRLFTAAGPTTTSVTATGVSIVPGITAMYVGRSNAGEGSNTLMGQFIYYDRALSDPEVDDMINYLQIQWNIVP